MSAGTPVRGVRIADDLWAAVDARAQVSGTTVSNVIRDLLIGYVRRFDTTELGAGHDLPAYREDPQ